MERDFNNYASYQQFLSQSYGIMYGEAQNT